MIVSVDLGFGWTKGTSPHKEIVIPSVIGESRKLLDNDMSEQDALQHIIYVENKRELFVGDLAIRQSPFKFFSLAESKADNEDAKILMKTTLALLSDGHQEKLKVVTGLPMSFYFDQKEKIEAAFSKRHEVKLRVNGRTVERAIEVECVKVVPQPLGSAMHWLLDETSQIRPENKKIAAGIIAIVDIGFFTADYLVLSDLEVLQNYSRSSQSGMSLAYKSMIDAGIDSPLYEIDKKVFAGELKELKESSFRSLATQISREIETYLPSKLDAILITGGGGFALYDYLNIPKALLVKNSNVANVRGYLKLGRRFFR